MLIIPIPNILSIQIAFHHCISSDESDIILASFISAGGNSMEVFAEYLAHIDDQQHRARSEEIFAWITTKFPKLVPKIAWNQPIFTDHDTFIIGFSVSKQHLAVSPESAGIIHFSNEIAKSGYDYTANLFRIKWDDSIDFSLLEKIIAFNVLDKADCSTFWRKQK